MEDRSDREKQPGAAPALRSLLRPGAVKEQTTSPRRRRHRFAPPCPSSTSGPPAD